ncbi:MAG: ATP-grasp domain-containing protein [Flavobacteriales bacterium]|nr:ATP-grasp domain-containing protein [Flavobacteriales bacterium]
MKQPIPQHTRIIDEALSRNFIVEENSPTEAILRKGNVSVRMRQGIIWDWINEKAITICDDKSITKSLFNELAIPCPLSYTFEKTEELSDVDWNKNYVLKPVDGSNGDGVKLNVTSIEQVHDYLTRNAAIGPLFLLEEFIEGYDLRIQVIGKKIVAACERIPAEIIGDGHSTVQALAAQRNEVVRQQNPSNYLSIDDESMRLIAEQGLTLDAVVPTGKTVRLKEIANMGRGARAVDCTDEIDPKVAQWVEAICQKLNVSYFALDIICTNRNDISTYKALELNAQAEWFHHTFSEVRQHDLEVRIVDELELGIDSETD